METELQLYKAWQDCQTSGERECLQDKIQQFGNDKIKRILLTPLDTTQINDLMSRYQKIFDEKFIYRGTFSCDFYAQNPHLNLDLTKRYTSYVLNLDPHTEHGSHWVTIFINRNKKQIEYFDSEGQKSNNRYINNFLNILKKKYKFDIVYNTRQFQFTGVQCGFYCVYYIIQRLSGKSFETVTKNPITDNDILLFRYSHLN